MMQTSRKTSRNNGFRFTPFSRRQKLVLTWWCPGSVFADYDGIVCDGAIRSGKSMTMSLSFGMWATENFNGCNFGICGKTIGSLRRNVINDMKKMLTARGYHVEDKRSLNVLVISRSGHSNDFYLFGGTNESSQDLIQGITLAGVFLDEAAIMPESFVNQATGRCSVEGAKLWFSCNPAGSQMHWFKQNWINQFKTKRLLYLHFIMDDNPSLSEKTKARYRSMYTGAFFRRYIEGRWVAAEGVIYDMWSKENIFTEDQLSPEVLSGQCRRFITVDYGTANPMVFLDVIDDGKTFWVMNEYYYNSRAYASNTGEQGQQSTSSKTDAQYADDFEEFVEHNHGLQIIIDPSASSFKAELRNRGYRTRDADNEVIDGIRMTATMIQKRLLRVAKGKCPNFEREIDAYIWDKKAVDRGEDAPVKQNDHAMDAIRYLIKTIVGKNTRRLAS